MPTSLLHISVSPRGGQSQSRPVGQMLVDQLLVRNDDLQVVKRDLGVTPPPHPDTAFINASLKQAPDRVAADHAALLYSEMLLGELVAADFVIIDTPMHNFTVPSALKAWIDYVVRPGRSFALSPRGKLPLLQDRPVRIAVACGGRFSGSYAQQDFLTPYLRYVFATMGITDLDFLLLEQTGRSGEGQVLAAQRADDWIAAQLVPLGNRHPPH